MKPLAFVLSRANAELTATARSLGAGWKAGVTLWGESDMEYLVLIAPTTQRMRHGAPLATLCRDVQALERTIVTMCSQLGGVTVQWCIADAVREMVMPLLLADAEPAGHS